MKLSQIVTTASRIGQTWAGIPGVEITPGGRLFIAWYSGGEKEPDPENTIYLCTSADHGATFTPPEILAVPRDGARAFDPTLWLAPTGALWLIFNRGNKDTAQHGIFARICAQPDAGNLSWGDEFRLGYDAPFSFRMNKPTVLSSGEWLMPVTHSPNLTYGWSAGQNQFQGVGISLDQGQTWQLFWRGRCPELGARKQHHGMPGWHARHVHSHRRRGDLAKPVV